MKKYLILMLINAAVLIGVMLHFMDDTPAENALAYRFTLVYPQAWNDQMSAIPDNFDELGANIKCVSFESAKENEQLEALQKAVFSRVDGIITVGTNTSDELEEIIGEAEKEGIPVVLVDSDLPKSARSGYVGVDNRTAGEKAGADMAEATGGQARVGIIVSQLDNLNQAERVEGFRSVAEQYPGMEIAEILECEADRIKIRKLVQDMLVQHPDINALYCTEMVSSEMVGEVLETMGYGVSDMQVVCSDMTDRIWTYISEGRYYSSVVQNVYEQCCQAVAYLKDYLNGKTGGKDVVYTGITSIKQDFDYAAWGKDGKTIWKLS